MKIKQLKDVIVSNQNAIIMAILEIVVGILLLVNPTQFTQVIFVVFGLFLILKAIGCAWRYFRTPAAQAASTQTLAAGLIALAIGIFCLARTSWFVSTFPVMTVLYGIVILLTAAPKIQWTIDAARNHVSKWFVPGISALVAIVCGAIVIAGPFDENALWVFAGITLIVGAILDAISIVLIQRTIYRAANPKPVSETPKEKENDQTTESPVSVETSNTVDDSSKEATKPEEETKED